MTAQKEGHPHRRRHQRVGGRNVCLHRGCNRTLDSATFIHAGREKVC
jgi:hypothetical protein